MSKKTYIKPDRQKMLHAAEKLFADKGFGACSLRDVITACNCSTTAFYARFESKEAVLDELVTNLIRDLRDNAMTELASAQSMNQGFALGVDVLVSTLMPRKGTVRLALTEASCSLGAQSVMQRSWTVLVDLLELRLGSLDIENPNTVAWALIGALTMQIMRWAVYEEVADQDLPKVLGEVAATFLRLGPS